MNGPNSSRQEPIATLFSGLILTRLSATGIEQRESVRFLDMAWAEPRTYTGTYGTLVMLKQGEFRFYAETFDAICLQVATYVGRLVKQGNATPNTAPKFPWVTDQLK